MINIDALKQVMIDKITELVTKECETYGGFSNLKVDIEITDDLVFAVSHCDVPTSTGMHRYGMYVYSALGFALYYHDSNVIDKIHFYGIDNVKRYSHRQFNYLAKLTEQYV